MYIWPESNRSLVETNDTEQHCERHIIAQAKLGCADSIGWLYERYAPLIRRYVASRIGDPQLAEDICNDVFVKVIESLGRYEDRGWPFSAWLYRIAYARTMDIVRQTRRRPSVPLDEEFSGSGETLDDTILTKIAYSEIQELMESLTSEQRMVLRLRFGEDRSLAEVAESLGRTVGSVKALQHRGLARLAEILTDRGSYAMVAVM
jgi:RNA polymerase sigma-70 factor, ECF subfamily